MQALMVAPELKSDENSGWHCYSLPTLTASEPILGQHYNEQIDTLLDDMRQSFVDLDRCCRSSLQNNSHKHTHN